MIQTLLDKISWVYSEKFFTTCKIIQIHLNFGIRIDLKKP